MQRALRQEIASLAHALAESECKRCERHRHRKAGQVTRAHAPDTTVRDCTSGVRSLRALAYITVIFVVPFWATKSPATAGKCLVCDEHNGKHLNEAAESAFAHEVCAADSVFYRCGHMCVCHGCAHQLRVRVIFPRWFAQSHGFNRSDPQPHLPDVPRANRRRRARLHDLSEFCLSEFFS
jgi:hypothetical protein